MSKVYLITGANAGLGKDATRQLALKEDTKKVYMACRKEVRAQSAIDDLVLKAGVERTKLAYVHFDGSESKEELSKVADSVEESLLHGLVLNAGGVGDDDHAEPGSNGVTPIAQINLIGHIYMVDSLQAKGKIGKGTRVIFVGTEGARGIPLMSMADPNLGQYDEDGFKNLLNGKAYSKKYDKMVAYSDIKGIAALYFAEWTRQNPDIYAATVSPGATGGTDFTSQGSVSFLEKIQFGIVMPLMQMLGKFHGLETGAKRYVDAVCAEGDFEFPAGTFAASPGNAVTGKLDDQATHPNGAVFADKTSQKYAFDATRSFI